MLNEVGGLAQVQIEPVQLLLARPVYGAEVRGDCAEWHTVKTEQRRRNHRTVSGRASDGAIRRVTRIRFDVLDDHPCAAAQRAAAGGIVVGGHLAEKIEKFLREPLVSSDGENAP